MHKSMLAGFIIDCQTDDLESAAAFWSKALGLETQRTTDPDDAAYVRLPDPQHGLHIEVQSVKHPSRVHIDIQADDIEAEAARLEKLGAKRIGNPCPAHNNSPCGKIGTRYITHQLFNAQIRIFD